MDYAAKIPYYNAFIDEFYRTYPENELAEVKNIANTAADNFLKLLISQP